MTLHHSPRPYNVLFLCTANSVRSIFAEAILRDAGAGGFNAFSAGSRPRGIVHPRVEETLARAGYRHDGLYSKGWQEFALPGAPEMDFVFTVCDAAAGEICPVWPGKPVTAHWGVPDPSAIKGTEAECAVAFAEALALLRTRIKLLVALPIHRLDRLRLAQEVAAIGAAAVDDVTPFSSDHSRSGRQADPR